MESKKPSRISSTPIPICKNCFKNIEISSFRGLFDRKQSVCDRCHSSFDPRFGTFKLDGAKGLFVYPYDELVRNSLFQVKGCHDIELSPIFLERYASLLKLKFLGSVLVPMPSWKEDDEARGFNHVEAIFSCLGLKMDRMLVKTDPHKQSEQNAEERKSIGDHIAYIGPTSLSGMRLVLVDDVMTTGSTLRAALKLVRGKGATHVRLLVVSKVLLT